MLYVQCPDITQAGLVSEIAWRHVHLLHLQTKGGGMTPYIRPPEKDETPLSPAEREILERILIESKE